LTSLQDERISKGNIEKLYHFQVIREFSPIGADHANENFLSLSCAPGGDQRVAMPGSDQELKQGESSDTLFDGKLKFIQHRRGYRFSLDAILLAAFVSLRPRDCVADLGTGTGVIPIILADRNAGVRITGFELQPALLDRARRSVAVNGFSARIQVVHGDIRRIDSVARPGSFDSVVCNPPYRRASSGRISPNAERQIARHESAGGLEDFLSAAAFLLRPKGRFTIVYLASRAVDLFAALRQTGLEPKRARMVHSRLDSAASLVLAEAVKGGRPGVAIRPPLIVYDKDDYTREVAAILKGSPPRFVSAF
jgi:tRNA1Val (adenine37-N6)-methyltransferase